MSNTRAILGGAAALISMPNFYPILCRLGVLDESPLIWLLIHLIIFLFAGFLTSSLAKTRPLRSIVNVIAVSSIYQMVAGLALMLILPKEGLREVLGVGSRDLTAFAVLVTLTTLAALLGMPLALLGGIFEVQLKKITGKRKSWTYRTQSGLEIPVSLSRHYVALGVFWSVLTAVGAIAIPLLLPTAIPLLLWVCILFLSASLARTHLCGSTDCSFIEGGKFVLYLRAFDDDEVNVVQGSFLGKMLHVTRFLREGGLEYSVVKQARQTFPVVAIGRPLERTPPDGALRIYVDTEHWQPLVTDLASSSRRARAEGYNGKFIFSGRRYHRRRRLFSTL